MEERRKPWGGHRAFSIARATFAESLPGCHLSAFSSASVFHSKGSVMMQGPPGEPGCSPRLEVMRPATVHSLSLPLLTDISMAADLEEGIITSSTFLQHFQILLGLTAVFNDCLLSSVCLSIPPRSWYFHFVEVFSCIDPFL